MPLACADHNLHSFAHVHHLIDPPAKEVRTSFPFLGHKDSFMTNCNEDFIADLALVKTKIIFRFQVHSQICPDPDIAFLIDRFHPSFDDVRLADKVSHKGGLRRIKDLFWGTYLFNLPVVDDRNPVGKGEGLS
jgi:hypothetical protein